MKIRILVPPEIEVPIKGYAGIELIAWQLAEELHKHHEVEVYARLRDDAKTEIRVKSYPVSSDKFDLTIDFTHEKHAVNHTKQDYIAVPFLTDNLSHVNDVFPTKAVRDGFANKFHDVSNVIVYPGISEEPYVSYKDDGDEGYLLFLGRLSAIKRPHIVIMLSEMVKMPAVIAGHAGRFAMYPDASYPDMIRQLCREKNVRLVEDPSLQEKLSLISKCKCLVVPSDWSIIGSQESFGIVAVEALMMGKPVIVSSDGGLKEIVRDGEEGYVASDLQEYIDAVNNINDGKINAGKCRERGMYFTSSRYAKELLALTEQS